MSNDVRRIGSDQSKALDSSTEEYTHLDAGHLSMNSECDARSTTRSPSPNSINLLKIAENKHRRLSAVLANSSELKKLIKQLKVEHSEENILFLQDLKHWKQITDLIEMKKEAIKLWKKYFDIGSKSELNVKCDTRLHLNQHFLNGGGITPDIFAVAEDEICTLLEGDSLFRFDQSHPHHK